MLVQTKKRRDFSYFTARFRFLLSYLGVNIVCRCPQTLDFTGFFKKSYTVPRTRANHTAQLSELVRLAL